MNTSKFYIYFNLIFTLLVYWRRFFGESLIYINILFLFLLIVTFIFKKIPVNSKSTVKIIFIGFIFSILCLPFNQTFGLGSYIVLFYFFVQFIYIYIIKLNPSELKNIFLLNFILCLVYALLPEPDVNSNSISQAFFAFGIATSIFIVPYNIKRSIIYISFLVFVIWGILNGESRMSLGAFILYILMRCIPKKYMINRTLILSILILLTVGSLVYAYVYTYMWWADTDLMSLENFSSEYSNKHIYSGRQLIWFEAYNLFLDHPFIGFGSKIELSSFDSMNLHNSLIALYGIYGCVIGCISLYLLIKPAYKLSYYLKDPFIRNCFCGYSAALLMGFNETYLINYSFIAFFPLMMAYAKVNYMNNNKLILNSYTYENKFYTSYI